MGAVDAFSFGIGPLLRSEYGLSNGGLDPCSGFYKGGQLAAIIPGMLDGEGEAEAAATWISDATETGALEANYDITTMAAEAKDALIQNGYSVYSETDSATVLSNGESYYTLYTRESTGQSGMLFNGGSGNFIKYNFVGH
jgi:hypothetical protein